MAYCRIISCSTVKTMHHDDGFHAPSTNADFAAFAIPTVLRIWTQSLIKLALIGQEMGKQMWSHVQYAWKHGQALGGIWYLLLLACGHLFGKSCIKRWFRQAGKKQGKISELMEEIHHSQVCTVKSIDVVYKSNVSWGICQPSMFSKTCLFLWLCFQCSVQSSTMLSMHFNGHFREHRRV
ncbi:unnamed protein product [Sphagnum balticum]